MAILSNGKFYGFLCSVKESGKTLANGVKEYVEDFVSGFAGHGWRLWEYVTGKWKLEIDTIVVRETMLVFEMLISKVRAIIGAQAITQGHGKVKSARISDDGTEYLIVLEDEDISIVAHDFVRCQTFVGDKTKLYHVEVSSVDVETKTLHVPLSEFEKDESDNILNPPTPGDELVQFGNSQNKARQSAIYMHADETGQPAIDVMFDLDSKNWGGKVKVRVGGDIPDTNGLKGFYCVNGMIKSVDDKGAVIYEFSPNGAVNIGKGNITYNPTTNKVTLGSGVTLTWENLSDEAKENLKGEPGEDGQDANLLPWIKEWNGYATELGEEYIVTPKMFSGTKSADGKLTGIAQGKDCLTDKITGEKRTGIFALVDNQIVFQLDPINKQYAFTGKVDTQSSGNRIVLDPETSSLNMYAENGWCTFSLSFVTSANNEKVYPELLIYGTEGEGVVPRTTITGREIKNKLYYSEGGYSADTTWGINENGIYHKKDRNGFSLNVDLKMTNVPFSGSGYDVHVTRFSPGYLPGYNTANNGEVYVTPDGTLKIKGYAVSS